MATATRDEDYRWLPSHLFDILASALENQANDHRNQVMQKLVLQSLPDIGEIEADTDLGKLIGNAVAGPEISLNATCVIAVAQKIVSKAEGRRVYLDEVTPSLRALELSALTGKPPQLVEMVLQESTEVLRAKRDVLIVRHRLGFVVANAGIDQSNVFAATARPACLLLPLDPAASACRIQAGVKQVTGIAPAIIITDSFGRPWRRGVVNIALGSAGLPALVNRRGDADRFGRPLMVTEVAFADALAAAAGIVMGEADEGNPVVVITGCTWTAPVNEAQSLIRPLSDDLFR